MVRSEAFIAVVFLFIILCVTASATTITVDDKDAKVNESFKLAVRCSPSEPIKSYEFKIRYDPRILSVTSLSAGDFFKDKKTFSSPNCVINNTDGTIINIYDLTLGKGNMVTSPGVLVYILFIAKTNGSSDVSIYDAGVTNDSRYLPLKTENGTVNVKGLYTTPSLVTYDKSDDEKSSSSMSFLSNLIIVLIIGFIIIFIITKAFV